MAPDLDTQQKPSPAEEIDQIPRQSLLELIPRRSLWKAGALLLLLVLIVFLQRRSDVVLRHLGQLSPAAAPAGPSPSTDRGARLRLAPLPAPGHSSSPSVSPFAPSPPSQPSPRNK